MSWFRRRTPRAHGFRFFGSVEGIRAEITTTEGDATVDTPSRIRIDGATTTFEFAFEWPFTKPGRATSVRLWLGEQHVERAITQEEDSLPGTTLTVVQPVGWTLDA